MIDQGNFDTPYSGCRAAEMWVGFVSPSHPLRDDCHRHPGAADEVTRHRADPFRRRADDDAIRTDLLGDVQQLPRRITVSHDDAAGREPEVLFGGGDPFPELELRFLALPCDGVGRLCEGVAEHNGGSDPHADETGSLPESEASGVGRGIARWLRALAVQLRHVESHDDLSWAA